MQAEHLTAARQAERTSTSVDHGIDLFAASVQRPRVQLRGPEGARSATDSPGIQSPRRVSTLRSLSGSPSRPSVAISTPGRSRSPVTKATAGACRSVSAMISGSASSGASASWHGPVTSTSASTERRTRCPRGCQRCPERRPFTETRSRRWRLLPLDSKQRQLTAWRRSLDACPAPSSVAPRAAPACRRPRGPCSRVRRFSKLNHAALILAVYASQLSFPR
jgi:hypothetical protein